jgi:hypothetical protein
MPFGARDDHAVGMPLHTAAGDGKAELIAMAIARAQVEPGLAQPGDGQILEHMAEGEDPQRLPGEPGARSFGVFRYSYCSRRWQMSPSRLPPR